MQLGLLFYKMLIKTKWEYENCEVYEIKFFSLSVCFYQRFVKKGRWGKFVLFLSLFLSVHTNLKHSSSTNQVLVQVILQVFLP